MGPTFSSSESTEVETFVHRVMEDDQLPDTAEEAILEAVLGNYNISEVLLENALNGPQIRVDRFYDYGRDYYSEGLPGDVVYAQDDGQDEVKAVLESITGTPVVIEYQHVSPPNMTHLAWKTLTEDYGYDQHTNELKGIESGNDHPVYLQDIVPVYGDEIVAQRDEETLTGYGIAATHGYSPKSRRRVQDGEPNEFMLQTPYETGDGIVQKAIVYTTYQVDPQGRDGSRTYPVESFELDFSEYSHKEELFQVKYSYQKDGNTTFQYWIYDGDSGEYPNVDNVFNTDEIPFGSYFPIVFFRSKSTDLSTPNYRDGERYKTTVKLLDYINLDYQELADSFNEQDDMDDIEQSLFIMAVPANSDKEANIHYLFEFFKNIQHQKTGGGGRRAIVIQDRDFKATLSYDNVQRKIVAGKLPDDATFTNSMEPYTRVYYTTRTGRDGQVSRSRNTETAYRRVYRKQLNRSYYEEVIVTRPMMTYSIYKSYEDVGEEDSEKLLIPVDKAITDQFDIAEKETIYFSSMHFIFNARVTETTSWYENAAGFILTVAALAITVYTGGSAAYAIATAASLYAAAQIVITLIVKSLVIQYTTKVMVREVGVEIAFVVAVVVATISLGRGYKAGSIADAPWSTELLIASNGLIDASNTQIKDDIGDYQSKQQEFSLYAEEKFEELEEVNDLLKTDSLLDPFAFIGLEPQSVPGESPDNFYQRTVHSGNIGTTAFDAIEHYVDMSLQLPSFDDSVGENLNA